ARAARNVELRTPPRQWHGRATQQWDTHLARAIVGALRVRPVIGEVFVLIHGEDAAVLPHGIGHFVEVAPAGIHEVAARSARILAVLADDRHRVDTGPYRSGHGWIDSDAVLFGGLARHIVDWELVDVEGDAVEPRRV